MYLLYHTESKTTYIGVTTDLQRRLRQHRGELVGGSKYTASIRSRYPLGQWDIVEVLEGVGGRSEACKLECKLKKSTGLEKRREAFRRINED